MTVSALFEYEEIPTGDKRSVTIDMDAGPGLDAIREFIGLSVDASAFLTGFEENFLGASSVLTSVELIGINGSSVSSDAAQSALKNVELPSRSDGTRSLAFVERIIDDGSTVSELQAFDFAPLMTFNHESGEFTASYFPFGRLDLGEEISFQLRLEYSGAVLFREVDITYKGGEDPIVTSRFGQTNSDGDVLVGTSAPDELVIKDLSIFFFTWDSQWIDVETVVTPGLGGTLAVQVEGDEATGVSDWFDLADGGRVRFVPRFDSDQGTGFQSKIEFDPDGDFDDLAPQESTTVDVELGLRAASSREADFEALQDFTLEFTVKNDVPIPVPVVTAVDDTVVFSSTRGFVDDTGTGRRGIAVDVLANDTTNGQPLSSFELVELHPDGNVPVYAVRTPAGLTFLKTEVNGEEAVWAYVKRDLAPGESVTASVNYAANAVSVDGTETITDYGVLTATVFAPTDAVPVARTDFATGIENDGAYVIDLLGNDDNPFPNTPLEVIRIDGRTLDGNGRVVTDEGILLEMRSDGTAVLLPDPATERFDYLGVGMKEFVSFQYEVQSPLKPNVSVPGLAVLTIEGENDFPIANFGGGDSFRVRENVSSTVDLLRNDIDPDTNDVLTVKSLERVELGGQSLTVEGPKGGSLSITPDGLLTFDPQDAFVSLDQGQTETFTVDYVVEDPHGAFSLGSADVTVFGLDQARVASDDFITVDEDGTTGLSIFNNDIDPDGGIAQSAVVAINGVALQPVGSNTITLASGAMLTVIPDIYFVSYTPSPLANGLAAGEVGTDSFTYTLANGSQETRATVSIDITGENDSPTAVIDTAFLVGAGPIAVDVLRNDIDPDGDVLSVDRIVSVSNGTATIESGSFIEFTPVDDTLGVSVVNYVISDAQGIERSSSLVVTIVPAVSIFGTIGDDVPLLGGAIDDTIFALSGDDLINGGAGKDTIFAAEGNDTVFGESGDDTISGGTGGDTLNGGDGNDVINGGSGIDEISGGLGGDTIGGQNGDDILLGGGGDDTVWGGLGNDIIHGQDGIDNLNGQDGADTLYGHNGNDIMFGGAAIDTMWGGDGDDTLNGQDGNDILNGGDGIDTMAGGLGHDKMSGQGGDDVMFGGSGVDTILGGLGADTIHGQDGGDTLNGQAGADTLYGQGGNDTMFGGADIDTMWGDAGNDTLNGQDGNDILYGGDGIDTLAGGQGDDTLRGQDSNDFLFGGAGIDELFGGAGRDIMNGQDGDDILRGQTGNDVMNGGNGADVFLGGTGNDVMNGGGADGARDTFIFLLGFDRDRINDFDQVGTDRVKLDDALWLASQGVLTGQEVVDTFGISNADNTILTLDFGAGDVLEIQNASGINAATFGADILIA